jgi:TPR repeat protein
MTDEIEECYRLFELEPGAGAEAVKQAYRELLMVWHPDRFPDEKFHKRATEKSKALNEAYQKITAYLSGDVTESRDSLARAADEAGREAMEKEDDSEDEEDSEEEDDFVEEEDFAWTLKSAQAGDSWSQIALAEMYLEGTKVPKNEAEAFRWYLTAASQGESRGIFKVGSSYVYGNGVKPDKNEAIKWLSRLAYPETTEDDCFRQMLLAQLLMAGIYYMPGEPRDPATAYGWLLLALCYGQPSNVKATQFNAGILHSEREMASMLKQQKEKLESELTAEQRAKGQKLAAELFRPKDYLDAMQERRLKEQEAESDRSLAEAERLLKEHEE